jgi:hypothetical protein
MRKTVLLLVAIAGAAVAQQTKAPWALTVEERIALRTNPDLARERVRDRKRIAATDVRSSNRVPDVDAFDGKTHPELFLPHEVFRNVIGLAFLADPRTGEVVRRGYRSDVERHGLPADFWDRLRSVSTIYISDATAEHNIGRSLHQLSGLARRRAEETLALKRIDLCRSQADALTAARREFGRERFDRFLYEVFAVDMFHASDRLLDPALLRRAEAGCR